MHEVSSETPWRRRVAVRSWAVPVLSLAVAVALLITSWQGIYLDRNTAPWIAGAILGVLGLGGALQSRAHRPRAALFLLAALCGVLAPVAQGGKLRLRTARMERSAMAELGGRPAPKMSYVEVVGEDQGAAAYEDGVVLLNFWATWCRPCLREIPVLQTFAEAHAEDPVRLAGVTAFYGGPEQDLARIEALRTERGVTYPTYVDDELETHDAFRAHSLPTTVLIDGGEVVGYGIGIQGTERVLQEAERRLAARERS